MQTPQISQHPQMTPDRAKAALGNASLLQSFLLPAHTPESKQAHMINTGQMEAPKPQPTPEQKPEAEKQPEKDPLKEMESKFMGELDKIKDLIEQSKPKDEKTEIADLKKQIQEVLNDTNEPDQTA